MKKNKILLVDDSALQRLMTKAALAPAGYEILEAADGKAGLDVALAELPELVVADVLMPSMDGYEFLRRLRADERGRAIKIIFYTGTFAESEEAELAKSGGVLFNLKKPAEPEVLRETVALALATENHPVETQANPEFQEEHLRLLTNKLLGKIQELEKSNGDLKTEMEKRSVAERETESAREFLEAFFDSLPQIAWVLREDGGFERVNQRWIDFHGQRTARFADWMTEVHAADREPFETEARRAFAEAKGFQVEARFRQKSDGDFVSHLIRAVPVRQHGILFWFGTCTDISTQKAYESELIRLKNKAEALDRAKSEFLANISHEVRTPLNSILGFSDLLQAEETVPELHDLSSRIHANAKRLVSVLEDVISISEIEANRSLGLAEAFRLPEFIAEITETVLRRVKEKGLDLRIEGLANDGANLRSYPRILRRILDHLLDNAVKFTDRGQVRIRTRLEKAGSPAQLCFEIEDSGVGIAPGDQEFLFQHFSQVDGSSTRAYGGLGLGLILARKLAESIEGRVDLVESVPGRGSRFRFEVPVEVS